MAEHDCPKCGSMAFRYDRYGRKCRQCGERIGSNEQTYGPFYVHDNIDGSFIVRTRAGALRAADWFMDRAEAERWCNSYNACLKMGEANLAAENKALRSALSELVEAVETYGEPRHAAPEIAAAKSLLDDSKGEA